MKRFACAFFLALLLTALSAVPAFAHGGALDASGGHRDTSNASGLGDYHYHHGHEAHLHPGGVCPYGDYEAFLAAQGLDGPSLSGTAENPFLPITEGTAFLAAPFVFGASCCVVFLFF